MIKKRRYNEKHLLLKLFKETPPNYLEPTVLTETTKGEAFYMTKDDTRIDGPWRDDDEVKVMTRQLKEFIDEDLYEWQTRIIDMCKQFDKRKIDLLYDPYGNIGKSMLCEYCEYHDLAEEIPPFRLMDDIFQWVYAFPDKPAYIVDLPRGIKKDKLGDFYAGLEIIKNGVAYDKRYGAKKIRFNRPRIFVFTNILPQFKLMSLDRWQCWEINENKELVVYTPINVKTTKQNQIIDTV